MNWCKLSNVEKIKVWLDDQIPMPADYDVWVKTAPEAIRLLESGRVKAISLDRDLGEPEEEKGTGYQVACFIEKAAHDNTLPPLEVVVHSKKHS